MITCFQLLWSSLWIVTWATLFLVTRAGAPWVTTGLLIRHSLSYNTEKEVKGGRHNSQKKKSRKEETNQHERLTGIVMKKSPSYRWILSSVQEMCPWSPHKMLNSSLSSWQKSHSLPKCKDTGEQMAQWLDMLWKLMSKRVGQTEVILHDIHSILT